MKFRAKRNQKPPPKLSDVSVVLARLDAVVDRLEGVYGQMRLDAERQRSQQKEEE